MNISEFERTKPVETMQELNRLINKYTNISKDEASEEDVSSSVHFVTSRLSEEVKDDLVRFRSIFHTGT
jgi:hypothetical protein